MFRSWFLPVLGLLAGPNLLKLQMTAFGVGSINFLLVSITSEMYFMFLYFPPMVLILVDKCSDHKTISFSSNFKIIHIN